MIKNRYHNLSPSFHAIHNHDKLVQAPRRRGVVLRENHDRAARFLDGSGQLWGYVLASLDLIVVGEGFDALFRQGGSEVAHDVFSRVLASEAQENVVFFRVIIIVVDFHRGFRWTRGG